MIPCRQGHFCLMGSVPICHTSAISCLTSTLFGFMSTTRFIFTFAALRATSTLSCTPHCAFVLAFVCAFAFTIKKRDYQFLRSVRVTPVRYSPSLDSCSLYSSMRIGLPRRLDLQYLPCAYACVRVRVP